MRADRSGDATDRLATITDARGITDLTNTYCTTVGGTTCPPDPAVVSQTQADGGIYTFDYVVTSRSVTQATVADPRNQTTTVARPRVRDGAAPNFVRVSRRIDKLKRPDDGFLDR